VTIVVITVVHIGDKTMRRLGRALVGTLGLTSICACQTIEPEPSQSNEQPKSALERIDDAHVNFQNTVDKTAFYDLPKITNWTILSLADFSVTREILTPSGGRRSFKLTNHKVEATKSSNSAVLVLNKIPSCEGAGGRIVRAGGQKWKTVDGFSERIIDYSPTGVEYMVLQGACSEIVLQPNGTTQEVTGSSADTIMFNLIPILRAEHMWDLHANRLILLDAEGRQRAEFLRAAAPN